MKSWHRFSHWISALGRRGALEADMAAEMRAHQRLMAEELEERGAERAHAERLARLAFGSEAAAQDECREARGLGWIEAGAQDVRFGVRMLRKNSGTTLLAAMTLGLGIAACAIVFSLVQSILLRRAPFRDAGRVVVVWDSSAARGLSRIGPNGLDYLDWRDQSHSFDDLFLFEHGTGTITGDGEPLQVAGLRVTPNFSDFLGIQPILGRTFGPKEARSETHEVLLGERFWRQRYGGAANVVGRGMELNGVAYTIIGVLPAKLNTVFKAEIVVPFDDAWVRRADGDLGVLGRLKRGVSVRQATVEMNGLMQRMAGTRPDRRGYSAAIVPLDEVRTESIRPALWILFGAVGFVLLLACANVANLMLGRAASRRREFALRRALGATPGRVARQCLAESALLALLGGGCGWLLAEAGLRLLLAKLPATIPVPNGADRVPLPIIHMGGAVLAFTAGVALLTMLVGLVPAVACARVRMTGALQAGERESLQGPAAGRARGRFVVVECALAILLLLGAGQMLVGVHRMLRTSLGIQTANVVTLRIKLANDAAGSPYKQSGLQGEAYKAFLRAVRAVPGVQSAGLTEIIPLSQDDMDRFGFVVEDAPRLAPGIINPADFRGISPGFIETMGIPLLAGRTFTDADDARHPSVVLIDAALARRNFGGQNPIGKHIQVGGAKGIPRRVVGVVGSVRDLGYAQAPVPTVYYPYLQSPMQSMGLVVRTPLSMSVIVPALKAAIHGVDPDQPVFQARTMSDLVEGTLSAQRLAEFLLDAFALLALAMTVTGVYGVTAYAVRQRNQEIGVRMALGAGAGEVARMVLRQGLKLALGGIAAGTLAAVLLLRMLAHQVAGLAAPGWAVLLACALLMAGTTLLATAVPARRAMRLDPLKAIRGD